MQESAVQGNAQLSEHAVVVATRLVKTAVVRRLAGRCGAPAVREGPRRSMCRAVQLTQRDAGRRVADGAPATGLTCAARKGSRPGSGRACGRAVGGRQHAGEQNQHGRRHKRGPHCPTTAVEVAGRGCRDGVRLGGRRSRTRGQARRARVTHALSTPQEHLADASARALVLALAAVGFRYERAGGRATCAIRSLRRLQYACCHTQRTSFVCSHCYRAGRVTECLAVRASLIKTADARRSPRVKRASPTQMDDFNARTPSSRRGAL